MPRRTSSGSTSAAFAFERDRSRDAIAPPCVDLGQRLVKIGRRTRRDTSSRAGVRCAGDRLRRSSAAAPFIVAASGCAPPMPPRPAVTTTRPLSEPPKVATRSGGESLVRSLQNSLGSDVNPAAGRHLAVHRQAAILEVAEGFPGGPGGHEQRVGDEHARRAGVRPEDANRLAGLHQQRLVVFERAQRRRRSRRTIPSCARPCRSRRTRRDRRVARRRRDRDCSSACAARLPAAIPCRTRPSREAPG